MTSSRANRALVLGLLSLALGVLGPFAVWAAIDSLRRIRAARRLLPGEFRAELALLTGGLATVFMLVGIARFVLVAWPR